MTKLIVSDQKGTDIRKGMMGLFFEDINYGADGGLYAEMLENRSFEFVRATGTNDAYVTEYNGGYAWSRYPAETPFVSMEYRTENPLSAVNPHYLHFHSVRPELGFINKAYDGIFMKPDIGYTVSLYMNAGCYRGDITVFIAQDGADLLTAKLSGEDISQRNPASSSWKKYSLTIKSAYPILSGTFGIRLSMPGEIDFDCISMMPEDAVCGVFRKDLAEMLKDLQPGFLRFPGGCIIEGNNLNNRYRWKQSVGEIPERKANWNRWAVHENKLSNNYNGVFSEYNQTLGLGYYEYFLLCEYLGAKAVPVVNVGLACQYQSSELVETSDPAFQEYVQDALDLVEFCNGAVTTTWGSLRAKMGHQEPFHLEFLGIGNEQWETERVNFFERYRLFETAIHRNYPEIKLIGSAGPDVHTPRYKAAWNFYRDEMSRNPKFTYAVDEHYYMPPKWFLDNTGFYDQYPRDVKVFSGEYAAHPERLCGIASANTLEGALAEAAFLTGVERNADVVFMASYAPLLARIGYVQWAPDMIWFDSETVFGTPSYYVQKMYSVNMGQYTLKTESIGLPERFYSSVSYDETKKELILKLVNATPEPLQLTFEFPGSQPAAGEVTLLGGPDIKAYNTIGQPFKAAAHTRPMLKEECRSFELPPTTFAVCCIPYSLTVN